MYSASHQSLAATKNNGSFLTVYEVLFAEPNYCCSEVPVPRHNAATTGHQETEALCCEKMDTKRVLEGTVAECLENP